ncbi:amidase [Albidovulum sediminicola]|uniref:Amidase n=1 Tax=Albidovulum sediminicola TaxID=2984331 RepID=A0ABT2Z5N4_9RHOB|nr:amidase [Defluviimonas sp. WL0075]MCV2866375.1 amidase [Defluviimonas sp. WL0075]
MTAFNRLGATDLARMIREGKTTPSAVMAAHLDRIAAREAVVGAFIHLDADRAMERARAADYKPATGPLHGVPFVIKDIIDTDDMPTSWGSEIFVDRWPTENASCVQSLLDAGAIPVGKTVTTEFAFFRPGKTANPWNLSHTPGGSSSGSAAAVADYMAPLAFGSQTAASLIRPAAYCGVCAFKPTTGAFDLSGVMTLAPSLDTLGVLARDPQDLVLAHALLTGTILPAPQDFSDILRCVSLMRGPHWQHGTIEMRDVCRRAMRALSESGAETGEAAHPPVFAELTEAHKIVMGYETARSRADVYHSHRAAISDQFAQLIEDGKRVTEARYQAALATRDRAIAMIDEMFADCDALLVPSAPGEAPEGLGATGDPLFSRMWSLLQLPCVALPLGVGPRGLPLGIQLIGRKGDDRKLLSIAGWVHAMLQSA